MTAKRPTTHRLPDPRPGYQTPDGLPKPQDMGDAMAWWLVSGGATSFLLAEDEAGEFDPSPAGVQMLCSVYVPIGQTGWIKQLRVAPYCPPELANPWQGWPGNWQVFESFTIGEAQNSTIRATAQAGVYTTPLGWESYFDVGSERLPSWKWRITLLSGTIEAARRAQGAGPFNITVPSTWFLVPDIAVPASVYNGKLPGSAPGAHMPPQRMQVLTGDELDLHVLIGENTTAILWAEWAQSDVATYTMDSGGTTTVGPRIPPILPAFGQMSGYMQQSTTEPANLNATQGW